MKPTNRNAIVTQGELEDFKDETIYNMVLFGALVIVSLAMILLTEHKVIQNVVLGFAIVMIVWNIITSYRYGKTKEQ